MGNKLRVAIYMRLSKADDKVYKNEICMGEKSSIADRAEKGESKSHREDTVHAESNSIQTQRTMLESYVQRNFSEYQLLEFSDDGYSGTNFNRPGVTELLELVKESMVDCIVVKDFSRFSRDYIELGSYLGQIFPFMGVRFISVNDRYDSKECSGGVGEMDVSFRHLLCDLYSKDLSVKTKASFTARKERGQYISANSPFGYEKAHCDKHMLFLQEDEAEIVRRIFSLTLSGYTSVDIAKKLNREGVKTPIEFKIAKGKRRKIPKGSRFSWSSSGVCAILRNEVYVGDMVYGKTEREPGGKNRLKPRSEWKIHPNHHEAIIDRETFAIVQARQGAAEDVPDKRKEKSRDRKRHPLTGTLVCACCGRNMIFRPGRNPYFSCPELYSNPKETSVKKANAMLAEQYVLFEIRQKVQNTEDLEKLQAGRKKTLKQIYEAQRRELSALKLQKRQAESRKAALYERYREGDGSQCLNAAEYQEQSDSITKRQQELGHLVREWEQKLALTACEMGKEPDVPELLDFYGAAELTGEIVRKFIEKIVVTDGQTLEIFWKEGTAL